MIQIGQRAPNFSLLDQGGNLHQLSDDKGKWVLVYFYPKDNTPGCTTEACSFRDNLPDFAKLNVQVFGISVDSVKEHKKFAEKYGLNFTLLADENKEVVNQYGVWMKKKFMGREYMGTLRTSFLIDPDGKIRKTYEKVKPAEHVAQVMTDLKNFKV